MSIIEYFNEEGDIIIKGFNISVKFSIIGEEKEPEILDWEIIGPFEFSDQGQLDRFKTDLFNTWKKIYCSEIIWIEFF